MHEARCGCTSAFLSISVRVASLWSQGATACLAMPHAPRRLMSTYDPHCANFFKFWIPAPSSLMPIHSDIALAPRAFS